MLVLMFYDSDLSLTHIKQLFCTGECDWRRSLVTDANAATERTVTADLGKRVDNGIDIVEWVVADMEQ